MGTLVILLFISCSKENTISLNELNALGDEVALTNLKGYDEKACISDDGKAGITCFRSVGRTCRKASECTGVLSMSNASRFFTPTELNNWLNVDYKQNRAFMLHMWENGYFIHPDSIQ